MAFIGGEGVIRIYSVREIANDLLNVSHKRGGPKARLLLSLGYRPDDPRRLESDLRTQHLSLDVTRTSETRTASFTRLRANQDAGRQERAVLLDLAGGHWN
jgi:hypothetical protein